MKINSIKAELKHFPLTRPYTIAYKTQTDVQMVILKVELDNGIIGLGCASPSEPVTGESIQDSYLALSEQNLAMLHHRDINNLKSMSENYLKKLQTTPAACAALDMALHDAYAQLLKKPLVKVLGQVHQSLPTSITIGIKGIDETLTEAQEYVARGFTHLKIKLGLSLSEDIARLQELRKHYPKVTIRVDPNQGYSLADCIALIELAEPLNLELIEQPMKVKDTALLQQLPESSRRLIALDESVLSPQDAKDLLQPSPSCGIYNIKLMKCGGLIPALQIAQIARYANLELMWGCNDESIISIAAALHAAFACPATRYLDLDGSLDLKQDVVEGGFIIKNGMMHITDKPGLGVTLLK